MIDVSDELLLKYQLLNSFDLQWFAEPEDEGRTEDPTVHKLKKAREEGKVAKSQDLVAAIHLLFCSIGLVLLGQLLLSGIIDVFDYYITSISRVDSIPLSNHIRYAINQIFIIVLPLMGIGVIAGYAGNYIQVGALFSTKPIEFDLNKIAPKFGRFFKEGFFSKEAMFKLGKSFIQVAVISLLAYINFLIQKDKFITIFEMQLTDSISFMYSFIGILFIETSIVFLLISLLDYVVQRRKFKRELQMSKYDVKREYFELEGNPRVKQYIMQQMSKILNQSYGDSLDEATFVLTNPTHYAIILKYDYGQEAPKVLGKGKDTDALLIRRLAKEKGVYIMENKTLARAMYADSIVGQSIPYQFYEDIANIIRIISNHDLSGEVV